MRFRKLNSLPISVEFDPAVFDPNNQTRGISRNEIIYPLCTINDTLVAKCHVCGCAV